MTHGSEALKLGFWGSHRCFLAYVGFRRFIGGGIIIGLRTQTVMHR